MTKRKALVLLLLACVVIAGLFITTGDNREPSYNGRKLSDWLDGTRRDISEDERANAIQQIGTNALPLLLERIQSQPPPLRMKFYPWLSKLHINPYSKYVRHREDAVRGFAALGGEAKPAIPALASLIETTNPVPQLWALEALGAIGKDSLPALLDVVTNSMAYTNFDRRNVGAAFWALETNAFAAKPSLFEHIHDRNWQIADTTVHLLRILGVMQETKQLPPDCTADIVPALCANLDNTNKTVLLDTIRALRYFRSNPRPDVPILLQKLTSPDKDIRATAAATLKEIDPQALQRAQQQ